MCLRVGFDASRPSGPCRKWSSSGRNGSGVPVWHWRSRASGELGTPGGFPAKTGGPDDAGRKGESPARQTPWTQKDRSCMGKKHERGALWRYIS